MNKKLAISVVVLLLGGGAWFYMSKVSTKVKVSTDPNAAVMAQMTANGKYLADPQGRSLYVFDGDESLKSNCVEQCAQTWPPFEYLSKSLTLATDPLSKQLNLIGRDLEHGNKFYQYAFGDKPLYYYSGDLKAGDRNGDGKDGKWHLVLLP